MHTVVLLAALTAARVIQEGHGPARVGGEIQPPSRLTSVSPNYPEEARKAGLEGAVLLECTIDAAGRVSSVKVLAGSPPLVTAAVAAVKKWRYTPTMLDGIPVPVIITVTVNFKHPRRVSVDELIASLRDKDEHIREAAAQTLGKLHPRATEAVPALMRAVNDGSERVRKAVARALGSIRTISELVEQMRARDAPVRAAAAWAIASAKLAEPGAAQALGSAFGDPDESVREAATWGLWRIQAPGFDHRKLIDTPPKPRVVTRPSYPQDAFTKKIQGTVMVVLLVSSSGRVVHAEVSQSVPGLDEAALACVRDWQFEPAMLDGRPVTSLANAPVTFRIY
jgi:TonB family protein